MITPETIKAAEATVAELRERGAVDQAAAIEEIIAAVRGGAPAPPAADEQSEIADLQGATGQQIKEWVLSGRYAGYRVGSLPVAKSTVEDYVRRAGPSLELEDYAPEEAARLVAEDRGETQG